MISKKTKRALQYLQTCYANGLILYPRVDNGFVFKKMFHLFPHPSMNQISSKLKPLPFGSYRIDKKHSLLFLSTARVLTPSNILSFAQMIDEVFDDGLNVYPEKALFLEEIIRAKKEFFIKQEIDDNIVKEGHLSLYEECQEQKYFLYSCDDIFFVSKKMPTLVSIKKQAISQTKKRKEEGGVLQENITEKHLDSFDEIIDQWILLQKEIEVEAGLNRFASPKI